MKESLKLALAQKMQQRLSPLQMRFVRMLEMTGPEVEEEVRREVDDNPALEIADRPTSADGDDGATYSESAEQLQMADYRDEDDIPSYRLEARNHSVNDRYFEPVAVAESASLIDDLMAQLAETDMSETDLAVARYIIGNLDGNGYMTRTLIQIQDDLAFNAGLDLSMEQLRSVFDRIRALDPPGIAALDLRDCLALQLRRLQPTEPVKLALEIVTHYFDLFSLRHFDKLSSALGVTKEQLQEAVELIRTLDPKPGSRMGETEADDRSRHIIPDFNVEVDDEVVTLSLVNNIPDLVIEESFVSDGEQFVTAPSTRRASDAAAFINRKREEATDFIELLRVRQETLYKVMAAIVKLQHDFFISEDESQLKPMILKDVAAQTGYDLSVISRATAGKYVATPGGVYPLKFFFNERVSQDEDSSSREILAAIREIIAAEDPHQPLSDDALMKLLNDRGYDIARRTVAKYRERLNIPVARLRKEI